MQLLVTAEQMRRLDEVAMTTYKLPGMVLMENAGRAFVDALECHAGDMKGRRVLVVCGKGNNGGDGFVIARHLANRGALVHVALVTSRRLVRGDARINLDALLCIIASRKSHITFSEAITVRKLSRRGRHDVIVDAIFGTGFSGLVPAAYKKVIQWMNKQDSLIAAVDIPSGIDSTTGQVANLAVKAHFTVAMGMGKIGHYVGDGREHSGTVEIAEIGIPRHLTEMVADSINRVEPGDVAVLLPQRSLRTHKYAAGKVLVVAGSRRFVGAGVMTAEAAMRSGAGAVVLCIPKSIHAIVARKVTEVLIAPLAETSEGTLAADALDEIVERSRWADAVAIGPGLSRNTETQTLVRKALAVINATVILDADGLSAIGQNHSVLKQRKWPTVLTPHTGELAALLGADANEIETHRVESTKIAVRKTQCIVVLKGAPTTTGLPTGAVFVNSTGNPAMATIGSGDVLTGVISSLIAQGVDFGPAAYAGVYLHGLAGDIASKKFGTRGVMATDILKELPSALKMIEIK